MNENEKILKKLLFKNIKLTWLLMMINENVNYYNMKNDLTKEEKELLETLECLNKLIAYFPRNYVSR